MKKIFLLFVLALSLTQIFGQNTSKSSDSKEDRNFRIPLIGEKAPSFTAETTTGTLKLPLRLWEEMENIIQPSTGFYACLLN